MGVFDHGFGNYEDILSDKNLTFSEQSQSKFKSILMTKRLKLIIKLVNQELKSTSGKLDFEKTDNLKEASGYTLAEKEILYELLLIYGVPTVSNEDTRDDWELLRIMLTKHCKGIDSDVSISPDNIKILEKFI